VAAIPAILTSPDITRHPAFLNRLFGEEAPPLGSRWKLLGASSDGIYNDLLQDFQTKDRSLGLDMKSNL
jgi:hypothetical protein